MGSIMMSIAVALYLLWQIGFLASRVDWESKPDINFRIQKLDEIENAILNLHKYIRSQKSNLQELEENILLLKQEKQKICQLIQTDKNIIETIFSLQETRDRKKVWENIIMGFIWGVISSIAATYCSKYIPILYEKLKNKMS